MTERLNNVTVVKPLVLGTYSFLQQAPANDKAAALYRWTVVLRSADDPNENMSYYIRSVEFNLHSTFTQPRRVIEQPPYEVTEVGWGEFDIIVKVFFHDSQERSVELRHFLKLRPDAELAADPSFDQTVSPVVKETYEEVIFNAPHEWFYEKLIRPLDAQLPMHRLCPFFGKFNDSEEFENLCEMQSFLRSQLMAHVEQLAVLDNDLRAQREVLVRSAQH